MGGVSVAYEKPSNEPFVEADLRAWPWGIGRVELDEGVAFVHARHPDGFTVDDLDTIPDDGRRYELLDGVVVVSPSPGFAHQRAVLNLGVLLLAAEQGAAVTLLAPYDVPLALARKFQPDALVLPSREAVVPVLCVEVLSPSGRRYDQEIKRAAYEKAAIPSYWLVDPDAPSIEVLELDASGHYVTVACARGDEECRVDRPFPMTVCPAALPR